jgi:hypothetical protein
VSIFAVGGYIGYGLIKHHYKCKINQYYTKKEISKYSSHYVAHIEIVNLHNYVDKINSDYTKLIEQITTNLLFKYNGAFGMSSYNNIYVLLPRNENMTYSVDKEDMSNSIGDTIINNIKHQEKYNICVRIKHVDIDKNYIGDYFSNVIHQNKFKFMKYLSKNSDVKITYNRNINPHNTKYMNKYFQKYLDTTKIDYITNPVYSTCYKCINNSDSDEENVNQVIVFKSELTSITGKKKYVSNHHDIDIDIGIDIDDFFTEDNIEQSCIVDNTKNYDIHYVENEEYNVYDNKTNDNSNDESKDSSNMSETSEESEESEKNKDDMLEYYNCRVTRDDINFLLNTRASSIQNALMNTYNVMCNMGVETPETLKYEILNNTYIIHDSQFGNNELHQFVLIEQTSNGNEPIEQEENPDTSSDTSDDMPPLIADSPHDSDKQELRESDEEVHVGEDDLKDIK